jgi:hypothetical protein
MAIRAVNHVTSYQQIIEHQFRRILAVSLYTAGFARRHKNKLGWLMGKEIIHRSGISQVWFLTDFANDVCISLPFQLA